MSAVDSLATLWHSREPRERTLISLAAAVLLLGALYGWIIDPALSATQRLKTDLPAVQTKLAQVKSLAASVKANPSTANTAVTQANVQASLSTANINATVSAAAPWVVTVNSATGEALWAWLGTHSTSKTTLKRSASGLWSGELVLE